MEDAEIQTLEKIREILRPYLSEEGNQVIDEDGVAIFYEQPGKFGTPLVNDGSCVYLHRNESGHAVCGIELAYQDGLIDFRKPVSCHLYPIRHESEPELGFEALNYDEWEICQAACVLGESLLAVVSAPRERLYVQVQKRVRRMAPWVPIAHSVVTVPASNAVKNFKISPTGTRIFKSVWLEQ